MIDKKLMTRRFLIGPGLGDRTRRRNTDRLRHRTRRRQ